MRELRVVPQSPTCVYSQLFLLLLKEEEKEKNERRRYTMRDIRNERKVGQQCLMYDGSTQCTSHCNAIVPFDP